MDHSRLHLGERLYQSPFNEASSVFDAEVEHESVIVKRRAEPMERELHVLQSLDNPLFPRVKSYFQQDDTYNLVLERKPGTPLGQLINLDKEWKSEILSIPMSLRITRELAIGLIALRNSGYYYRDFNLNHILVDDGVTGLVDHEADVRIEADGGATVNSRIGTWETMAPEEFTVDSRMAETSTTYSLAVILHQLTHGYNLFHLPHTEGKTMDEMREMSREHHTKAIDLDNVHRLQHFLGKALQSDPSQRHQTIEEFLFDIDY